MEKKRNLWVIPTDKPSRILFDKEENRLLPLQDSTVFMQYQDLVENQHIYITNEEEIKESGWYEHNGVIFRADDVFDDGNNPNNSNPKVTDFNHKIILTTDQDLIKDGVQSIDDEFLEWFVKNSSCKRVEIRYTVDFNSKAVIIIPKEEPKQVTLEEVAEEYAISKSSSSVFQKAHIRDFIAGAKWQQERMYSENDLKEAFKQSRRTNIFEIGMPLVFDSFEDWFKQYKK